MLPSPFIRLGLISCSDPDQRTELFFPGKCRETFSVNSRSIGRRPRQQIQSRRPPRSPPAARAFLVVAASDDVARSILDAEEVRNFAEEPGESLVRLASKRLGGDWRDLAYQK